MPACLCFRHVVARTLVAGAFAAVGAHASNQPPNPTTATMPRLGQGTTLQQLRAMPPTTIVQMPSGRTVKARSVLTLTDALRAARTSTANRRAVDLKMSRTSAPVQVQVRSGAALAAARSMPGSTVIGLPNGMKLTVDDVKKLEDFDSRAKFRQMVGGRALSDPAHARFTGKPVVDLRTRADVEQLRGKGDDTIVRTADGSVTTLGDLKAALKAKFGGR